MITNKNKDELLDVLKDYFEDSEITTESIFDKDKMDSFEKMNLLVLLDEYSGKELSIIELFECDSIGDIIEVCI